MKVIYTESALVELESFQKQRKDDLEKILISKKYVFGDDVLEITASDVREAERYFKASGFSKSRLPLTNLLLKTYFVAGIVMTLIGLFYETFQRMISQNPNQLILILSGFMLSIASVFGSYYFRIRENKREELERKYMDYEIRAKSDFDKDS